MKPRAHLTFYAHVGPFQIGRSSPEEGWSFRCGGSADPGAFLTEEDDEGRSWLTRFWTGGDSSDADRWGFMLGVRVHVPDSAIESLWGAYRGRQFRRRDQS